MPVEKAPAADLRRRYPLYAEVGLALALGAVILAFTVPAPASKAAELTPPAEVPIELVAEVPITAQPPPPPPPPAPPPPQEVPDDVEVDDVIETLDVEIDDVVPPPAPPTPVVVPRPEPPVVADPPAPPPPPVVEAVEPDVFDVAEVQPELVGGLGAIRPEYPEYARRAGVEGTVVVRFVVDERGRVVDPVVARSPNDLLSQAALDAVREIRFTPGQQRGRPVKVRFAVPVTFRLR